MMVLKMIVAVLATTSIAAFSTPPHDQAIARLQHEYQELQKRLRSEFGPNPPVVTDQTPPKTDSTAQNLLEKALDMTAVLKYKQTEQVELAKQHVQDAKHKVDHAQAMHRQAHENADAAATQAAMMESMDDDYEDLERLRDLSVVHAAHHVEEDSQDLSVEAQFEELEAELEEEESVMLLKELEQREMDLKATLKELKELRNEKAIAEWAKEELPKHEHYLKTVRTKLIDHDPTKGNVAF